MGNVWNLQTGRNDRWQTERLTSGLPQLRQYPHRKGIKTTKDRTQMNDFEEYIIQGEPSQKEKAQIWQTAIGLQDVDGLKGKMEKTKKTTNNRKIVALILLVTLSPL